ncbi:aquaporin AQPcic [Manduca sexta]|nr:aquaporin AQPcic [Manduca sexta]
MSSGPGSTPDVSTMRCCGCGAENISGGEARGETLRVCGAEAAGAALLVLLSCLPACLAPAAGSTHSALAAGFVVAMLVQCFDHISGAQMNPTVTLASMVWGRVSGARGLAMMAAQLAGATLGGAALHLLQPADTPALCVTAPAPHLSVYKAVALEAVLGGCLALANCASWDERNLHLRDSWPLRVGVSVAAMSLVAGDLTGASMNPVRSFAPALWSGVWQHHWVYWAGPLSGSALSTALYVAVWRPRPTHAPHASHAPRPPRAAHVRRSMDSLDARAIVVKTQRDG